MAKIVLDDPEIYQDRDFLNLICQLSPRVFESIMSDHSEMPILNKV